MALRLRSERRARTDLDRQIGHWPRGGAARAGASSGSRIGSPSWLHARSVWEGERARVGRARIEGDEHLALSVAFVEAIAKHAQGCRRCAGPGALDTIGAGEWLLWALAKVPATRAVLGAVLGGHGMAVPREGLPLPGADQGARDR